MILTLLSLALASPAVAPQPSPVGGAVAAVSATDPTRELLELAEAALDAGDLASAARWLDQALAVDPDDVDTLFSAATVARELGRADAAVYLTRILQLDPFADDARLALAEAAMTSADAARARAVLDEVLARHPELPEALALRQRLDAGPLPRPSRWQALGRLDLAAGWDSNLTLASTVLPEASLEAVGMAVVDAAVGTSYETAGRPFAAFARLTTQQPLTRRGTAMQSAATLVGAGLVGRRYVRGVEAVVDLRYDEVFTDSFGTHQQRLVVPTLSGAYGLGTTHRLRLLAGGEYRRALGPVADVEPSSFVALASLRDTMRLGRWLVAVEARGRRAFALDDSTVPGASRELDFLEWGGQGYAEVRVTDGLGISLVAGGARRGFDDALRPAERTLSAELGVRYAFRRLELHAEYGFSDNDSALEQWRWQRHTVFAGVRAYAP